MPLLIKFVFVLLSSLVLVDQSQLLCSAPNCSVVQEAPAPINLPSSHLDTASAVDRTDTTKGILTKQKNAIARDAKAVPLTSHNVHGFLKAEENPTLKEQVVEGGIEGTGVRVIDVNDEFNPTPLSESGSPLVEPSADNPLGNIVIQDDISSETENITDANERSVKEYIPNEHDSYSGDEEDGIEGTGIIADAENQLIAYGPITQFGSIYVNGIKYETDDAELEFVNSSGKPNLSIGMMVQVHADWQQHENGIFHAQKVIFDHQIEGPIESVTRQGDQVLLDVLGTTVIVDSDTATDLTESSTYSSGSVVKVSGLVNENGEIVATYMALISEAYVPDQQVELEGLITHISAADKMIKVNGFDVDVSSTKWKNGDFDGIKIGSKVEVIGQYNADGHKLTATRVRVKNNDLSLQKGNKLTLDTIIAQYESIESFELNGYQSDASKAEISNGVVEDLGNGTRVKVSGHINQWGIFEIQTLRIKPPANFSAKVQVDSINYETGAVGFFNLSASVQSDTLYQSRLKSPNKYFSFQDVKVGDWIAIQGVDYGGQLQISSLSALRNKRGSVIKGMVQFTEAGGMSILGVDIQPTGDISTELMDSIKEGNMLTAKGNVFDGNTFYVQTLVVH